MKKLMIALAGAASFAAMALPTQSSFEGITAGVKINETGLDANWSQADGDPASAVAAYVAVGEDGVKADYNGSCGSPLDTPYGSNYLALDTGGGELFRWLDGVPNGSTSTVSLADAPVYIDTLVQFTATDPSTEVEIAADAKLAIWMVGDSENGYTLNVRGGRFVTVPGEEPGVEVVTTEPTNYVFSATGKLPNTWYRLTVKAIQSLSALEGATFPGFVVYLDGEPLATTENAYSSSAYSMLTDSFTPEGGEPITVVTGANKDLLDDNMFIPSAQSLAEGTTVTLESVSFQGSGALDDFVVTTDLPNFLNVIDFTLTWPAGVTAVSYTIDGVTNLLTGAVSGTNFQVRATTPVDFTFTNADGVTKTMSAVASTSVD